MAALAPAPKFYQTDENGAPLAGGFVYTYISGTTTPLATYTDAGGGTPNTNPVQLDSAGRCNMWLLANYEYKFVVTSATGTPVYTVNNISASATLPDVEAYIDSVTTRAVNTMAALRLLSFADWQRGYAFGYYAKGDGGGGSYYYDSSDTTTGCKFTGSISGTTLTVSAVTNGTLAVGQMVCRGDTGATVAWIAALGSGSGGTGTYTLSASATVSSMTMMADDGGSVIVAADGGRWKNTAQGQISVRMFGAGNGDSTYAIQAAVNSSYSYIVVPPGTFRVDGSIHTKALCTIEVQGNLVRQSASSAATTPVVIIDTQLSHVIGTGRIISENASPDGVVLFGVENPSALPAQNNILWSSFDGPSITGVKAANNIGLCMQSIEAWGGASSLYCCWVNPGLISSVGIGIYMAGAVNAHHLGALQMWDIRDYGIWFAGDDGTAPNNRNSENTLASIFVHQSFTLIASLRLVNSDYNVLNGLNGEPGSGKLYSIEGSSDNNHLEGVDNHVVASTDTGTRTMALINDEIRGIIKFPTTSKFSAYLSASAVNATGDGTAYSPIFNTEIFDANSNYNNATGQFVAPVTGQYQLSAFLTLTGLGAAHNVITVNIVTSNRTYFCFSDAVGAGARAQTQTGINVSALCDMDAADFAYIQVTVFGGAKTVNVFGGNAYSCFSGILAA